MSNKSQLLEKVTILFAGDSGDGIQMAGSQFSDNTALHGNDLSTFPDFPAEIRAPGGTVEGVSGFQIHFGSQEVFSPGDKCDVLVAMNAAALKKNIKRLKPRGTIVANIAGFDKRNLRLAYIPDDTDPLTIEEEKGFQVTRMDVTKLTREALKEFKLGTKEKDRCKNFFVLGYVYWMYNRSLDSTIEFIKTKFASKQDLLDANIASLKAGYHFGDTLETFSNRYEVRPAKMPAGEYRNIMGNQATVLGLVAAAEKSGLELFYGSYPITPASDILHQLSQHRDFGVRTFQAEDEIAAIGAAIGASFGGHLAVTASSGPGIALKGEAIGLAFMLELPLVIVNVQRGGPSTGLPTKTEQADLFQALYGRNGETPIPVIAAHSPSDCFDAVFQATKIALEHMTPVFFLSDGYIANGAEPWRFPKADSLSDITIEFAKAPKEGETFLPYARDERGVRPWSIPGQKGLEHRVGGLEKEDGSGNVSYDPDNHEKMTKLRQAKVDAIAEFIPDQEIDSGVEEGVLLVLAWGSTYGSIKTAMKELVAEGYSVAHAHIKYLMPFPKNLGDLLSRYKKVLIPEINNGQLIHVIRDKYLIDAIPMNKIKGVPFEAAELRAKILECLKNE